MTGVQTCALPIGVAQAAQSAANGASETQAAAQGLARLAAELQAAVGQFKYDDEAQEIEPRVWTEEKAPKAPHLPQPSYRSPKAALHER